MESMAGKKYEKLRREDAKTAEDRQCDAKKFRTRQSRLEWTIMTCDNSTLEMDRPQNSKQVQS